MVTSKVMVPTRKTLVPPNPTKSVSEGLFVDPHLLECRVVEDIH